MSASSRVAVASSRISRARGAQSGLVAAVPASYLTRPASANRPATSSPAGPIPTTTASTCSAMTGHLLVAKPGGS